MFSRFSLNVKLQSAFAVSALTLVVVGGIGALTVSTLKSSLDGITSFNLPNIIALADMRYDTQKVKTGVTQLALPNVSSDERRESLAIITSALADYKTWDKAYLSVPFAPGEEALYNKQNDQWKIVEASATKLIELSNKGKMEEFLDLYRGDFTKAVTAQREGLGNLVDFHKERAKAATLAADAASERGHWTSIFTVVIGFLVAQGLGYFISRSLSTSLLSVIRNLEQNSDNVSSAAQSISASGAELSSSTTEQAAALQETMASVDEISAMVGKNADNANSSRTASSESQKAASLGRTRVSEMIESMKEIDTSNVQVKKQIDESNQAIANIASMINEIGEKTKIINDIVFQTKLLSFNASVEAARAGEHGKGFAVVAEEIGNLARMSGTAATEITQLLEESTKRVDSIVEETTRKIDAITQQSRAKVARGSDIAKICGDALDVIVKNVSQVGSLVEEIATASNEQSKGVNEITKAMAQMDQVTQRNSATSAESSSSSEGLAQQAVVLNQMVGNLLRIVEGAKAGAVPTPMPAVHYMDRDVRDQAA